MGDTLAADRLNSEEFKKSSNSINLSSAAASITLMEGNTNEQFRELPSGVFLEIGPPFPRTILSSVVGAQPCATSHREMKDS